jgi:FkbM family methyltransferase
MKQLLLAFKQTLVGTRPGRLLQQARWWTNFPRRVRHPELWDLYLEPQRMDIALTALVKPDFNCLDVGSHVGSTLAQLSRLAPEGHHIAVEAIPDKAHSIRRRFGDVRVINAAVAAEAGTATLYEAKKSGYSSLRRPVDQEVTAEFPVDVLSLDDVVDNKVDFVKLDVEGAELPALQGAVGLLDRDRPIVLFECGPHGHTDGFGYSRVDLFDFLRKRGFDVYSLADFVYGRPPMSREEFDKAGHYPYPGFNYLALSPEVPVQRLI